MSLGVMTIGRDDVHVWVADLAPLAHREGESAALLDADELQRAARFRFPVDRTRYVLAHGVLRLTLARYVDRDPRALTFERGQFGKPSLSGPLSGAVEFNLSHSDERVLVAVARRPVGVDVERRSERTECERVAEFVFSQAEQDELTSLPSEQRRSAFFAAWARKEAYIKATGYGLAYGLDTFDVSLARLPRVLADRRAPDGAHWTLRDVDAGAGYAAAVVAAGSGWHMTTLRADAQAGWWAA
ncbi:MAG TPA: 4'-phosphopantetheinyl transferase superfamily protein [Candidatus Acidoferrum sp.]|nr:4'-phosphopantetheinyl transferase superfamily protein [Candidatus Acidoferrum sp.]